jgi:hypothetical protein
MWEGAGDGLPCHAMLMDTPSSLLALLGEAAGSRLIELHSLTRSLTGSAGAEGAVAAEVKSELARARVYSMLFLPTDTLEGRKEGIILATN